MTDTDVLITSLLSYGKIEVKDLGIFTLKTMKARVGYNPGIKSYEEFPAYNKVSFEPSGKKFKARLKKWKKKIIKKKKLAR